LSSFFAFLMLVGRQIERVQSIPSPIVQAFWRLDLILTNWILKYLLKVIVNTKQAFPLLFSVRRFVSHCTKNISQCTERTIGLYYHEYAVGRKCFFFQSRSPEEVIMSDQMPVVIPTL